MFPYTVSYVFSSLVYSACRMTSKVENMPLREIAGCERINSVLCERVTLSD